MEYKRLDTNTIVENISSYIKDHLKSVPFTSVYVGTDSQNHGDYTVYATAIVLHFNSNNGGHVIYSKEKVPRIKDQFTRLWGEVQRSYEVAVFLRDDCNIPIQYIDLDLNANKKWESNKVLPSAVGLCEASGFHTRCKPGEAFAVRIADVLCR
jgi:predicted RNase H-related nuclease YkuK (DUF458 family)